MFSLFHEFTDTYSPGLENNKIYWEFYELFKLFR